MHVFACFFSIGKFCGINTPKTRQFVFEICINMQFNARKMMPGRSPANASTLNYNVFVIFCVNDCAFPIFFLTLSLTNINKQFLHTERRPLRY